MHSATARVATLYGAWCLLMLAVSAYGMHFAPHGEYGVSAHLWLLITGLPSSLLSWAAPHGSLLAVAIAGGLGLVQWCVAVEIVNRYRASGR